MNQVSAVILAGGFGTRLQGVLQNVPKPMAPVAGRPFLEWVIRFLAKQGIREVVLSTGYLSEVIEAYFRPQPIPGVTVQCVPETTPLGTAGGFLNAVNHSRLEPHAWLLLNGDTLAFVNLSEGVAALKNEAVSGVIFGRELPDASRYGSLISNSQGMLERFAEKQPGQGVISTGIYLFRDRLVKSFESRVPFSLEHDVFPALTASGASVKVIPMNAPFIDIGLPETLREADAFVRANRAQFDLSGL